MRSGHYRQYAKECLRLANETSDPSHKAVLIDMALAWRRLSEQTASFRTGTHARLAVVSDDENLRGDALLPERDRNTH